MCCFEFGPFRLDERERLLLKNGESIPIRRKAFSVLIELVENSGSLVSYDQLHKRVWSEDAFVTTDTIANTVLAAKKALGEWKDYIQNVSGYGYKFLAEVRICSQEQLKPGTVAAETELKQQVTGADPKRSPYPGPGPFTEDRTDDFFGRIKETDDLVELLSHPEKRVVLLYSASGAGKTSLINTRLRAELIAQGHQVLPIARVGVPADLVGVAVNPFTAAAIASMEGANSKPALGQRRNWKAVLCDDKLGGTTIVVVDQLEELLTSRIGSPAQKKGFFSELREVLLENSSVRLLLAFREEYHAQMLRTAHALSEFSTDYPLSLLSREDAILAISKPAMGQGVHFDSAVLSELVNRLATTYYVDANGQACEDPGDSVEPLQLQMLCNALWKNLEPHQTTISLDDLRLATQRHNRPIDKTAYPGTVSRFIGSVLHAFCDEAAHGAVVDFEASQQRRFPIELVDLGCVQFVTDTGRRPILQEAKWTGDLPNEITNQLASRQLLRIEQRFGERWFELAHDTLIKPITERAEKINDETLYTVFTNALRAVITDTEFREEDISPEFHLLFIGEDGTPLRPSIDALKNANDRMPASILQGLASHGILRECLLGGMTAYELTNERLARAVYLKRSPAMDEMYRANETLTGHIERSRRAGGSKEVWYEISASTVEDLRAIELFIGLEKLSQLELEYVLRASLASGYRLDDSSFITQRRQKTISAVLLEAILQRDKAHVRKNAATMMGQFELEDRETLLINLALEDPDQYVQIAAAKSLACCGTSETWNRIFELVRDQRKRKQALTILAWINDVAPEGKVSHFQSDAKQLSTWTRICLRARLTQIRATGSRVGIFVAAALAVMITMLFTAPTRAMLATFNLTTTQKNRMGLVEGAINGALGVAPWALFIGGGLLVWWFVVEGRSPCRGKLSPLVGMLGGMIGGVINTLGMVYVYGLENLIAIHWIPPRHRAITLSGLTQTGAIFIMTLYGTVVGLGVGFASRGMLRWMRHHDPEGSLSYREKFWAISFRATLVSWVILVPMLAVAIALYRFG